MSSPQKTGLAHKTGTVIVGAALLSSLMLTACGSPASTTADSNSKPSASAAAESPKGTVSLKSDAFDMSKQTAIDAKNGTKSILLDNGAISTGSDGDKLAVVLTPYEGKDGAWKYTSDVAFAERTNNYVELMRWKDKSYIVVVGTSATTTEASGLTPAGKTTTEHVTVLDAETGKVVNTLTGTPNAGPTTPDSYVMDMDISFSKSGESQTRNPPFMTGLRYHAFGGSAPDKLVDPLTGQTVATTTSTVIDALNNESGFFKLADFYTAVGGSYEKTSFEALYGNFALLSTAQPEFKGKSGYLQNSKFSLVNTVTKKVVSEMTCGNPSYDTKTTHSPDFRYVTFFGNYVFDTQTGKSFCTTPMDNVDVRKFVISAVDNNGKMYGTADKDYLRISLADKTKSEKLATFDNAGEVPIFITGKGSAVFYGNGANDVLVTVPAK